MQLLEYFCYLIIFLIPTYLIRFSVFGFPINFLEVLVFGLFLSWLLNKKSSFIIHHSSFLLGVALIFTGLFIGVLISPDWHKSLGALKGWFLVPLLFSLVAHSVLDTREKKERAFFSLALSGSCVAGIALAYWILGITTFDMRLGAFYDSPNILAMYIAPALLIISWALKSKLKTQNLKLQFKTFKFLLVVLAFGFLVSTLLLTRSLGIMAAFLGALAVYPILRRSSQNRVSTFFAGVTVFAFVTPFISLALNPWALGRNSFTSRLMIWKSAFLMIRDHWFFGIGPGIFQEYYLAYQKNFLPYLEWAAPHPHNIFLATWLYAGIIGLVGFLLLLYSFFYEASKNKNPVAVLATGLVIFILLAGAFDNSLWRTDSAMIFWVCYGFRDFGL